jgi:NADPH-dependent ferric siderophore reductase
MGSLTPMAFSRASVVETIQLSARLRRIVLQIDDPDALAVSPGGDSAVGVYLSPSATEGRNYSVRHHEGDRITVDVVLHARGLVATWARGARPGDRVGLDHARSWYRPESSTEWQLLVTDLSGLPATARIIEELPGGLPVTAIVEVADREDVDYLPRHPDVAVIASIGTGNGSAPSRLAQLVTELAMPDGRGYCWFAGEATESRAVRKYFRGRGWATDQLDITGYWRLDSETWDAKFAAVQNDVVAVYERALAEGKGDKVASEEFDEALERVGL